MGVETLSFFAKSGAFAFGIGYGMVRTRMLQRKENRIQAKQDAAAKKKAAIQARKTAKKAAEGGPAEDDFFGGLFKEG